MMLLQPPPIRSNRKGARKRPGRFAAAHALKEAEPASSQSEFSEAFVQKGKESRREGGCEAFHREMAVNGCPGGRCWNVICIFVVWPHLTARGSPPLTIVWKTKKQNARVCLSNVRDFKMRRKLTRASESTPRCCKVCLVKYSKVMMGSSAT